MSNLIAATGTSDALAAFRAERRQLEAEVLPVATSVDGRRFVLQASLHDLALRAGGYVTLESDGPARLGQLTRLDLAQHTTATGIPVRHAAGEGLVLDGDGRPFHDARVRPADAEDVRAWTDAGRARLAVGELALVPGVAARLDARGFGRHTFLCGQSGSGKTYALGVLLEQLLLETSLRIVVLDPNSDFTRLAMPRAGADRADDLRAATASLRVHGGAAADERLRLRVTELDREVQAALAALDPVDDREEYAELAALLAQGTPAAGEALEATGRPEARRLALRLRNLGVEDLAVWARGTPGSVLDAVVDPAARCVVVDLGALATATEQALVAAAVLGRLWDTRERREPVLIVADEAHNVCPADPGTPMLALATERAVRIAAEGRKFGLHLLVSTQRPQKVDVNVVSQCDNLVLMRLNSRADAAYAQEVFSFAPGGLIEQAPLFGLGEALVAGAIAPQPAFVRVGPRLSEEGGADVPATWAG